MLPAAGPGAQRGQAQRRRGRLRQRRRGLSGSRHGARWRHRLRRRRRRLIGSRRGARRRSTRYLLRPRDIYANRVRPCSLEELLVLATIASLVVARPGHRFHHGFQALDVARVSETIVVGVIVVVFVPVDVLVNITSNQQTRQEGSVAMSAPQAMCRCFRKGFSRSGRPRFGDEANKRNSALRRYVADYTTKINFSNVDKDG